MSNEQQQEQQTAAYILRSDIPLPSTDLTPSRSIYPWDTMADGQAFFIPVTRDQIGKRRATMRSLAVKAGRRYGRKFEVRSLTLDGKQQPYIGVWLVQ